MDTRFEITFSKTYEVYAEDEDDAINVACDYLQDLLTDGEVSCNDFRITFEEKIGGIL